MTTGLSTDERPLPVDGAPRAPACPAITDINIVPQAKAIRALAKSSSESPFLLLGVNDFDVLGREAILDLDPISTEIPWIAPVLRAKIVRSAAPDKLGVLFSRRLEPTAPHRI
jgi:hypothetical protein